jgi:hypothetical protein
MPDIADIFLNVAVSLTQTLCSLELGSIPEDHYKNLLIFMDLLGRTCA